MRNVVSGDETNCDWAIKPKKTLNWRGAKTVEAQGACSSGRASVMLCVSAAGEMLHPFLIFTGSKKGTIRKKELVKLDGYPTMMRYTTQGKAWMDEVTMLEWVDVVWKPFVHGKLGLFLLLIDEASSHLTAEVMKCIGELRTILVVVPGGYTSKLQIMDVGINKPFKQYYEDSSEEFVRNWVYRHEAGVKPKPTRVDIAKWVSNAWNSITKATVMNTWRKCGYIDQCTVDEWMQPAIDDSY
jgi:hypothetical protein